MVKFCLIFFQFNAAQVWSVFVGEFWLREGSLFNESGLFIAFTVPAANIFDNRIDSI